MSNDVAARDLKEAISTILAKICYPVAEELGAEFGERVSRWRQRNALRLLKKAEQKRLTHSYSGEERAHPRLVHRIVDEGSWSDDDHIQDMWAGLLASSCSHDGQDESNILFVSILSQLTSLQAKVLAYACLNCDKEVTAGGWISPEGSYKIDLPHLERLVDVHDIHRLDRELDHLRVLGLISVGFHPDSTMADITPTPLALQLYVRCQGYVGSPAEYFGLTLGESQPPPEE